MDKGKNNDKGKIYSIISAFNSINGAWFFIVGDGVAFQHPVFFGINTRFSEN